MEKPVPFGFGVRGDEALRARRINLHPKANEVLDRLRELLGHDPDLDEMEAALKMEVV